MQDLRVTGKLAYSLLPRPLFCACEKRATSDAETSVPDYSRAADRALYCSPPSIPGRRRRHVVVRRGAAARLRWRGVRVAVRSGRWALASTAVKAGLPRRLVGVSAAWWCRGHVVPARWPVAHKCRRLVCSAVDDIRARWNAGWLVGGLGWWLRRHVLVTSARWWRGLVHVVPRHGGWAFLRGKAT